MRRLIGGIIHVRQSGDKNLQEKPTMWRVISKFCRVFVAAGLFGLLFAGSGSAAETHAGYYYPAPQTYELYVSPLPMLRDVTKLSRVGLLVGLNARQYKRAFAPGYHMFGKGEYSEKLIIVAVEKDRYQTLFQLRALLASMSSMARTSPLFAQTGSAENLNFLDLLKIAGFSQLTLTNGIDVSHRISIK